MGLHRFGFSFSLILSSALALAVGSVACSTSSETTSSGGSGNGGNGGNGNSANGGGSGGSTKVSSSECQSRCEAKATKCGADAETAKKGCAQNICNEPLTEKQVTCLEGLECENTSKPFAELCPAEEGSKTPPSTATTECGSKTCGEGEYCSRVYDPQTSEWEDDSCKALPSACKDKTLSQICTCLEQEVCPPATGSDILQKHCSTGTSGTAFGCRSIPF